MSRRTGVGRATFFFFFFSLHFAYLSSVVDLSSGDLDEALNSVLLGSNGGNAGNIDDVLLVDL